MSGIGALEEQLAALQETKSDMRALRQHLAGLEEEIEQLSTANGVLQRDMQQKIDLVERHARRAEMQQERIFSLEADAEAAADLRNSLMDCREEIAGWRERCLSSEQHLSEVGRSHELLLATLVGTCERLLRPLGGPDETPLAWQEQLHHDLVAVVSAPLVVQASRGVHAIGNAAAGCASAPKTPETSHHMSVMRESPRAGWTPAGSKGGVGWKRRGERADITEQGRPDDAAISTSSEAGVAPWWLSTANELRVERGQLVATLEQRRRESRVERALLSAELATAERQWPSAAIALRRSLQPVLAEVAALPAASKREAKAARADHNAEVARKLKAQLDETTAASESTAAQLERSHRSTAAVEAQLVQARARAEAAEQATADEVRRVAHLEMTITTGKEREAERECARRLRLLDTLRSRIAVRYGIGLLQRTFAGWSKAAQQR